MIAVDRIWIDWSCVHCQKTFWFLILKSEKWFINYSTLLCANISTSYRMHLLRFWSLCNTQILFSLFLWIFPFYPSVLLILDLLLCDNYHPSNTYHWMHGTLYHWKPLSIARKVFCSIKRNFFIDSLTVAISFAPIKEIYGRLTVLVLKPTYSRIARLLVSFPTSWPLVVLCFLN